MSYEWGLFKPQAMPHSKLTFPHGVDIHFLGAPVWIHGNEKQARKRLAEKWTSLLETIDTTLVTRQQKLQLFKLAICQRLTWELSVNYFPICERICKKGPFGAVYKVSLQA